ncbi:flagellar basal body-associated FliL family protein [Mangrovihabitans endophyticus]|uniref:Flagellar protein FliL n=1 Tax=Mangrovihabitans endophyticus TaxID=1751298 RepID=A0A8J3FMG0_9ACTN|nr:flagellar basal body-associated FliL family protein [Mangrovihabitans endophyticus]GGK82859.1 hypothetical protein GCM10012284_16140 [Mangrovihabitans endophyticus]
MSKDEKDGAEKPKSKKMLMIIIIAVVALAGGGVGAYLTLFSGSADAATVHEPVKGEILPITDALTVNLADGHYLKFAFALQMTEEAAGVTVDLTEAIDLGIAEYTGKEIGELETAEGREKTRTELLHKIEEAYNTEEVHLVMGLYYTQFVTQ